MPRAVSNYFLTIVQNNNVVSKTDLFHILVDDVISLVVSEESHVSCSNDLEQCSITNEGTHLHCYFKVNANDIRFSNIGNVRQFLIANLEIFGIEGRFMIFRFHLNNINNINFRF